MPIGFETPLSGPTGFTVASSGVNSRFLRPTPRPITNALVQRTLAAPPAAASALATSTTGGNLATGQSALVETTFVILRPDGTVGETIVSPASASVTTGAGATNSLTISGIPIGPPGTIGRNVYCNLAAAGYKRVVGTGTATINDNVTTQLLFGTAGLTITGAAPPGATTAAYPVPKPPYLSAVKDELCGTWITRVADNATLNSVLNVSVFGGTSLNATRHDYASREPWNSDESLLALSYDGNLNPLILDGNTFAPIATTQVHGTGFIWSEMNPYQAYVTFQAQHIFDTITNVFTSSSLTQLQDFKTQGALAGLVAGGQANAGTQPGGTSAGGGCTDDTGRYFLLSATNTVAVTAYLIVYDILLNTYAILQVVADTTGAAGDYIHQAHISHTGKYISWTYNNNGTGTNQGTWIAPVNFTPTGAIQGIGAAVQLTVGGSGGHSDFAYDTQGNEVLIMQYQLSLGTGQGQTYGLPGGIDSYIVAWRADFVTNTANPPVYNIAGAAANGLRYFTVVPLTVGANSFDLGGGHCCGRMNKRPGYMGFSHERARVTGATPYNVDSTFLMNGLIYSVQLDASIVDPTKRLLEVWAAPHHQGETQDHDPEATWNRDGTKVCFASEWALDGVTTIAQANAIQYESNSYVAQMYV